MAEENKLNQTPEITPAPSAEAPEKAPTTGELLGDVEHYDEEKDDWSTGYYGTGSRHGRCVPQAGDRRGADPG